MCLIVVRDKGQNITKEFFEDVFTKNKDGWGIMWVSGKGHKRKAKASKGLVFDKFWEVYNNLQANDVPCIVHFRYATQGLVTTEMCHPFKVADGVYMMHNGQLDTPHNEYNTKELSDTWAFVDQAMKPLMALPGSPEARSEFMRTPVFDFLAKKAIGTGNRVVFLDKDGAVFVKTNNWARTSDDIIVSNTYGFTLPYATKPNWKRPTYTAPAAAKNINDDDDWEGYEHFRYNNNTYQRGYHDSKGNWIEGGGTRSNVTPMKSGTPAVANTVGGNGFSGYRARQEARVAEEKESTPAAQTVVGNGAAASAVAVLKESLGLPAPQPELSTRQLVEAINEVAVEIEVDEEADAEVEEQIQELLFDEYSEEDKLLQHIFYAANDEDYAEEVCYNEPELAIKMINYLVDGGNY